MSTGRYMAEFFSEALWWPLERPPTTRPWMRRSIGSSTVSVVEPRFRKPVRATSGLGRHPWLTPRYCHIEAERNAVADA